MTQYHILTKLGEGGMGEVYLASRQTEGLDERVAKHNHFVLKILKNLSQKDLENFLQEASISTMMRHENIANTYGVVKLPKSELDNYKEDPASHLLEQLYKSTQVLETKTDKGLVVPATQDLSEDQIVYCMEMEHVKGTDLKNLQKQHIEKQMLIPVQIITYIMHKTLKALEYAHKYIVHRDISPDNVMINTEGVPKLTDFGIAAAKGSVEDFAGKIAYASPEQLKNLKLFLDGKETAPLDVRTDIYSLGLTFYELLTGINPLMDHSKNEEFSKLPKFMWYFKLADHLLKEKISDLLMPHEIRTDIPKELSQIVDQMLDPEPDYRYKTAAEVRKDLKKKFFSKYKTFSLANEEALEAYLTLFDKDFKNPTEDEKDALEFMKGKSKPLRLRFLAGRTKEGNPVYTNAGMKLIKLTHRDQQICKMLRHSLGDDFEKV